MAYTTTDFITNVKRTAAIPTSQTTFTADGILAIGYGELGSSILPMIMKSQEAFYEFDVDTAINASGIYNIPTRAVGGKLVNMSLIDGDNRHDLDWITEEGLGRLDDTGGNGSGAYIKRNQLYLVPKDGGGFTTLRQTIIIRPGRFVQTTAAAQITGINTGTNTLTFASGTIPATFTTAETFDFIQAKPHFDHVEIDKTASSVTTTTMVFSSLDSRLAVGDWVALAGESPIIQVPVELQDMLELETAKMILLSQGDMQKLEKIKDELKEKKRDNTNLYTPRIEKEGKKIVPKHRMLRRL